MPATGRRAVAVCCGLAALVGCAAAPGPASARTLHTVLQDDDLALFTPGGLRGFVGELRWLGVDRLRVSAEWKLEVPNGDSRRPPPGFNPTDPGAYTGAGMRALDLAVRTASRAGIGVIIDPAFSAPLWATSDQAPAHDVGGGATFNTSIDVREAAAWEQMLARRYSGSYVPPGESGPLPRVSTFTLWNEPNNWSFLKPQWQAGKPVSADWYRSLVGLAYPAIKRANPDAEVLVGNTSYGGSVSPRQRGGVAPLAFIRRLACVDRRLRPLHDDGCRRFRTVQADGFAHHSYEPLAPPWVISSGSQVDWAQMGDLDRLAALLARLVAMHRLAPGAANIWLTEQGYESNAELRDRPWTEAQQAQLNADSEYLAWRSPQVSSVAQFLIQDTRTSSTLALRGRTGDPRANLVGTWTTGLRRENGQPKPALWMFRSPVVARAVPLSASPFAAGLSAPLAARGPRVLEVWGRARPARSPVPVQVQLASDQCTGFQTVADLTTDANGIFDTVVALPRSASAAVRFRWRASGGDWQVSPTTDPVTFPVP